MTRDDELLKLDYEQTLETYRQFVDIRFKILAFVPTLSGIAVALLTSSDIGDAQTFAISAVGFIVSLGIVIYDQRNSQYYNGAISRAQYLEGELQLPAFGGDTRGGLFRSRDEHKKKYFWGVKQLRVSHGLGTALIYSPVMGAWAFGAADGIWPDHAWLAAGIGALVTVIFLLELLRLD
jgi:hypothetical protein